MLVGEVDIERPGLLHRYEPVADVTLLPSPNPTAAYMECIGSNPIGGSFCVAAEHGRSIKRSLVRREVPAFKELG